MTEVDYFRRALWISVLLAVIPATLLAIPINIVAYSFEDERPPNNGGYVPGWDYSPPGGMTGAGTYYPGDPSILFNAISPGKYIPDGKIFGWSNGGSLSQVLPDILTRNMSYFLQVDVGQRKDCCESESFPVVALYAGSTLLASVSVDPAPGGWVTASLRYTTSSSDPLLGQPLKIVLSASGIQANFDNVRLDGTMPEPAAVTLVLAGLIAGIFARRRTATR